MADIIRFADCPPLPWKNGAGTTRELWARRDSAGAALIRISIAEISGAQDFSAFPGIDRVIVQLDGPPMTLTIDGVPHPLAPLTPLPFAGEARVACRTDGSGQAHDLNLMCQRGSFRPAMRRLTLRAGEALRLGDKGTVTAVLALSPCAVRTPVVAQMEPRDVIVASDRFSIKPTTPADLIVLEARPATDRD